MRTGALRHRVAIERLTTTYDQWGDPTTAWAVLGTVWAAVEPLKGDEYFTALSTQTTVSHRVTMRHPGARVTPADRLNFGGRLFDIKSAINTAERNAELVLMCLERV